MEYWKHDWEGWRAGTDLKEKEDTTVLYARDKMERKKPEDTR